MINFQKAKANFDDISRDAAMLALLCKSMLDGKPKKNPEEFAHEFIERFNRCKNLFLDVHDSVSAQAKEGGAK